MIKYYLQNKLNSKSFFKIMVFFYQFKELKANGVVIGLDQQINKPIWEIIFHT